MKKIKTMFRVVTNDLPINISIIQPMRYCEGFISLQLVGKLKVYYLTAQIIEGTYGGAFYDQKYKSHIKKQKLS